MMLSKRQALLLNGSKRAQGIKVTDAESKNRIRKLLAKEAEARMDTDSDGGWEEITPAEAADVAMRT